MRRVFDFIDGIFGIFRFIRDLVETIVYTIKQFFGGMEQAWNDIFVVGVLASVTLTVIGGLAQEGLISSGIPQMAHIIVLMASVSLASAMTKWHSGALVGYAFLAYFAMKAGILGPFDIFVSLIYPVYLIYERFS